MVVATGTWLWKQEHGYDTRNMIMKPRTCYDIRNMYTKPGTWLQNQEYDDIGNIL